MENNENVNRNDDQDLQREIRESERNPDFESNLDNDADADERLKQQREGEDQLGLDSDEFNEMGNNDGEEDLMSEDDDSLEEDGTLPDDAFLEDEEVEDGDDMVENLDDEDVPGGNAPADREDQIKGSDADYYK